MACYLQSHSISISDEFNSPTGGVGDQVSMADEVFSDDEDMTVDQQMKQREQLIRTAEKGQRIEKNEMK